MAKYTLCPRCELNYILEGEDYCDVCKAELKIGPQLMFSADLEVREQILCPICKIKYINEDEEMCEQCREESKYDRSNEADIDIDKDDEWRQFLDDDEKDVMSGQDEEEELLLSQIEEEELEEDDEDIDPYTNEKISKNKKFEDDFEYAPIDESDFEDYDEEEDDEDDFDEEDD